ncbi:MAG: cyanophycin synthetase, partial [Candidatus Colwellbacteria bacterium]
FNKSNILAALTFSRMEGIPDETSFAAIEGVPVMPGRMEFVDPHPPVGGLGGPQGFRAKARGTRSFRVLVDYAFLPQALEKVYETLNKLGYKKLIAVTGACGGGRDKWKRPRLGDIAAKFCVKVYVTNEDPYDEDPMEIIHEVAGKHKDFIKILDRREAIREALKAAKRGEGDAVVITGKGAEPWIMGPKGSKIAWDDREIVREELKKI